MPHNLDNKQIFTFKIKGFIAEKDYFELPFGRQLEYAKKFVEFKSTTKRAHLSQKHKSFKLAILEFVKLNDVTEYCTARFFAGPNVRDDSFEIFYKTT